MKKRILAIIIIIIAIIIFLFVVFNIAKNVTFGKGYNIVDGLRAIGGKFQSLDNVHKVNWAGHEFEVAYLDTLQYKTTGNKNIEFTEKGWHAPSYSMPRSRLLDVNLNEKVKVTIKANFEGEMTSSNEDCTDFCMTTERYHFSEFPIYIGDEDWHRKPMKIFGTRESPDEGNVRNTYNFPVEFTVENNNTNIIFSDNSGFKRTFSKDLKYILHESGEIVSARASYGEVNTDQKYFLVINCHVNAEGYCKLNIKEIIVE